MYNMKMSAECCPQPVAESEVEDRYPCIYLDIPPTMLKAITGLKPGSSVTVTLKARVKAISLKDAKESYNGSAGSIDLDVRQADIKASGDEFAAMTEEEDD